MFDVTLDGQPYQEMHVDGGAFAQAFLYPAAMTRRRRERMRNGQLVGAGDRVYHPQRPARP